MEYFSNFKIHTGYESDTHSLGLIRGNETILLVVPTRHPILSILMTTLRIAYRLTCRATFPFSGFLTVSQRRWNTPLRLFVCVSPLSQGLTCSSTLAAHKTLLPLCPLGMNCHELTATVTHIDKEPLITVSMGLVSIESYTKPEINFTQPLLISLEVSNSMYGKVLILSTWRRYDKDNCTQFFKNGYA